MLSIKIESISDPPYVISGFSWNAYINGVLNNQQLFTFVVNRLGSVSDSEYLFSNARPGTSNHENRFGDRNCRHDQTNGVIRIGSLQSTGQYQGVGGLSYPKLVYTSGDDKSSWYPLQMNSFEHIQWGDPDAQWYGRIVVHPAEQAVYNGLTYYRKIVYRRMYTGYWQILAWTWTYADDGTPLRWGQANINKMYWSSPIWPNPDVEPYFSPNFTSNFQYQASRIGISNILFDPLLVKPHYFETYLSQSPEFHPDLQDAFGPLADRIVSQASFPQVNLPAYFRDLFKTGEDVLKLARSVAKLDIKSLSDSYLSYKYGMTLTVKDTLELARGLTSRMAAMDWQSRKARDISQVSWRFGQAECQYAYKVYYSLTPKNQTDFVDDLFMSDVLGLGNAWDLVPFSFVADWFVNIGDFLEQLDNTVNFNQLPVLSTVASIKLVANITEPDLLARILGQSFDQVTGSIDVTVYSRTVLPELIVPKLAWERPSDFNHFLEAGALIVSTRYKR